MRTGYLQFRKTSSGCTRFINNNYLSQVSKGIEHCLCNRVSSINDDFSVDHNGHNRRIVHTIVFNAYARPNAADATPVYMFWSSCPLLSISCETRQIIRFPFNEAKAYIFLCFTLTQVYAAYIQTYFDRAFAVTLTLIILGSMMCPVKILKNEKANVK